MQAVSMILSLLCGVALFLFGMSLMGEGLKSVAGNKLESFLYKMTNTPAKGILLGTGVTSVIQSSSATTVMVIGFVNSGLMKLSQAIAITLGANIGTSITGWILCLSYIEGSAGIAKLLSSATISAVAAIAGILCRMLSKRSVYRNLGNILMGFAVLMVGMQTMSAAVSPLKESSAFIQAMTMFSNPFLGILLGIVMTAILQSASASIGIVQALSVTGALTFATAFPVILGIGVGAACPVMLSAIGANKNGVRTALAYLLENVFGMLLWGIGFYSLNAVFSFPFMQMRVNPVLIAMINSAVRIDRPVPVPLYQGIGEAAHAAGQGFGGGPGGYRGQRGLRPVGGAPPEHAGPGPGPGGTGGGWNVQEGSQKRGPIPQPDSGILPDKI